MKPSGKITGVVTDASGAVIPGVTVVATNTQTGDVRKAETNASGVYVVEGAFDVTAPRSMAWDVLTDYDGIDNFVSSMQRSVVRERHPDHVIVEQDGVGKLFVFSKRIHVVLEVREVDQRDRHLLGGLERVLDVAAGKGESAIFLAKTFGCDVIVMSSHRPAMKTYFLGSNAGHMVRYAKCSVLVVRKAA